jgi:hypothetical protein
MRSVAVTAALGCLALLAPVLVAASPAQAYNLKSLIDNTKYAVVNTSTSSCTKDGGTLTVVYDSGSDSCFLNDTWDDTYFEKDVGGKALKVEVRAGGGLLGKVEFHPLGEHLWVYDLVDDDDTFYVEVDGDGTTGCPQNIGTFRAPEEGYLDEDLGPMYDLREGCPLDIFVFDNAKTDQYGYYQGYNDFFTSHKAVA